MIRFARSRYGVMPLLAVLTLGLACAAPATVLGRSRTGGQAQHNALPAGTRISFDGDSRFLLGANVPWFNWGCDFGCGDSGGVSDPGVQAQLTPVFQQARQAGVRTLRWWMFEDDPRQIQRDSSGKPTGLNPTVYKDIDAALALAAQYDLSFDFVLFSSPTAIPRGWLTDGGQRQALANVLAPLFAHYSGNAHILAWEILNEPEFDIWNGKIDGGAVKSLVRTLADDVHANSSAYVTIGAAELDGLPMWEGLGLDFYTAHWYDYMSSGDYDALLWSYSDIKARYNLDAPLVIGELYLARDSQPLDRLHHFYDGGYAGAWPWSLFPDHTSDNLSVDLTAVNAFNGEHDDISPAVNLGVSIGAYTPYHAANFTISGTSSPASASSNSSETAVVSVTSDAATSVLVDVEVYSPNGDQVTQQFLDEQSFTAGETKQYKVTWTTWQQKGDYTVKTGVFMPGWGKQITWNNDVADVQVR
jgi:hypothetical protein